jgi:hypothetical protein
MLAPLSFKCKCKCRVVNVRGLRVFYGGICGMPLHRHDCPALILATMHRNVTMLRGYNFVGKPFKET